MARSVIRLYTRFRRSICSSEALQISTTVPVTSSRLGVYHHSGSMADHFISVGRFGETFWDGRVESGSQMFLARRNIFPLFGKLTEHLPVCVDRVQQAAGNNSHKVMGWQSWRHLYLVNCSFLIPLLAPLSQSVTLPPGSKSEQTSTILQAFCFFFFTSEPYGSSLHDMGATLKAKSQTHYAKLLPLGLKIGHIHHKQDLSVVLCPRFPSPSSWGGCPVLLWLSLPAACWTRLSCSH